MRSTAPILAVLLATWVMLATAVPVAPDIRRSIEDSRSFPRELVYRTRWPPVMALRATIAESRLAQLECFQARHFRPC